MHDESPKGTPRVGTRVVYQPNPISHTLNAAWKVYNADHTIVKRLAEYVY